MKKNCFLYSGNEQVRLGQILYTFIFNLPKISIPASIGHIVKFKI